jgi:hypothetical protein
MTRMTKRDARGGDERDRLALHGARCRICKHPEREEIEREFLEWVSPREIAARWKIASYRAIYRHAQAVGLQEQRRRNRQGALDCIIEHVREVQVTANAVLGAIRLGAKLEREENEDASEQRGKPGFVLSLDGLPRTDAVTGRFPQGECDTRTLKAFEQCGGRGKADLSRTNA